MPKRDGFQLWNFKLFRRFRSDARLEQFSPEEFQKMKEEYEQDQAQKYQEKLVNMRDFGVDNLKEYDEERTATNEAFLKTEIDGYALRDDNTAPNDKAVLTAFAKILQPTKEYYSAKEDYSTKVSNFMQSVSMKPHGKSTEEIRKEINDQLEIAEKPLKAQQKFEIDELTKYLDDNANEPTLRSAYQLEPRDNFQNLKNTLLDKLKEQHAVQDSKFKEGQNSIESEIALLESFLPPLGVKDPKNYKLDAFVEADKRRNALKTEYMAINHNNLTLDTPDSKEAADKVINELTELLTPRKAYTDAMTAYKSDVETLKNNADKFHIAALEELMSKAFKGIRTPLERQHKEEITKLETLLNESPTTDDNFLNSACKAYKVDPNNADEVKKLKDILLNTLVNSHKKQLDDLEKERKATDQHIAGLRDKYDNFYRTWYLTTIMNNSQEMRDEIWNAKLRNSPTTTVRTNMQGGYAEVDGVTLDALNFIVTKTGSKMEQDPKNKGTWTINFKPRLQNPLYYFSNKQNPLADMLNLAAVVKASGSETITFKLKFDEPPFSERGRQAFEAAIRMGFDPKNIKIINVASGKTFVARDITEEEKKAGNIYAINHQDGAKDKAPVSAPFAASHQQKHYQDLIDEAPKYMDPMKKIREGISVKERYENLKKGENYEELKKSEIDLITDKQDEALKNQSVVRPR